MWGCLAISESIRPYTSALTSLTAFLNNFENVVNDRIDIREDIRCYQDTLSHALSKVEHGRRHLNLPSDMNMEIKSETAGYNNKILVSSSGFSLRRNDMVNTSVPENSSHKTRIVPKHTQKEVLPHQNTAQL